MVANFRKARQLFAFYVKYTFMTESNLKFLKIIVSLFGVKNRNSHKERVKKQIFSIFQFDVFMHNNFKVERWVLCTLFENYPKCRIWIIWIFLILTFSTIFCPIKTDLSGNTVWPKASNFQKLAKMDNFAIFN